MLKYRLSYNYIVQIYMYLLSRNFTNKLYFQIGEDLS